MANPASAFVPKNASQPSVATRAFAKVGAMLNTEFNNPIDAVRITREGIAPEAVEELVKNGFKRSEISWIVAPRTLSHRRKNQERLNSEETGRWLRAARVQALSVEVFGDPDKALRWLHKPRKMFDSLSAIELLQTEAGAQLVEDTLGQLDAGYFA